MMESKMKRMLPNMKSVVVETNTGVVRLIRRDGKQMTFVIDGENPAEVLNSPIVRARLRSFNDDKN